MNELENIQNHIYNIRGQRVMLDFDLAYSFHTSSIMCHLPVPMAVLEPFWKFAEFTMPYSPQPDRKVYSRFAPSRIPRIYISDASTTIRVAYADVGMPTAETLAKEISRLNE